LRTVLGVIQAGVVAGHAQHGGGHAHANAGLVHHVEHVAQAFARLTHQVAHGPGALPVQARPHATALHRELAFAKVEQGVGGASPATFVVQAGQRHIVAHAGQLALGVHQLFGHDEQRNALHPRWQLAVGPGYLRQHQVDDVLGQLVLAGRNPHLVATQAIAWAQRVGFKPFAIGHRAGGHVAQA